MKKNSKTRSGSAVSRRQWLAAAAGAGAVAAAARNVAFSAPQTSKLRLTMACWDYDRVRAIMENRVTFDGIEMTFLPLIVEETFFRMMRHQEFDVSEMSLSSYTLSLFQ